MRYQLEGDKLGTWCSRCEHAVDEVTMANDPVDPDVVHVRYACHGEVEMRRVVAPPSVLNKYWTDLFFEVTERRVFLRNWARYATTTKPERRAVVEGFRAKVR